MERDLEKSFLLLNQTFALAEFLSLKIVLGIKTPSNQRRWSTNCKNFQYELISQDLSFHDNDVWLKSGKIVDQQVIKKEQLFDLNADCLTVLATETDNQTEFIPQSSSGDRSTIDSQSSNDTESEVSNIELKVELDNSEKHLNDKACLDDEGIAESAYCIGHTNDHEASLGNDSNLEFVDSIEHLDDNKASFGNESSAGKKKNSSDKDIETMDTELVIDWMDWMDSATLKSLPDMRSSHKITTYHLCCRICSSHFSTAALLKQHVLVVHDKVKPLKCRKCDYKCAFKSELKIHDLCHHQEKKDHVKSRKKKSASKSDFSATADLEKDKRFECPKCEYKCVKGVHLREHVSAVHERLKPFQCSKCDHKCNRERDLKYHLLKKHQVRF